MKRSIFGWWLNALLIGLAGMLAGGCATVSQPGPAPLRVGVTPDYPPLVMEQNGKLAGLEVELATLLGAELDRPVEFHRIKWREQFDSLLAGKTDIIMSGLSVTRERQLRVLFTEPHMKNAIMGMVRRDEAGRFTTADDIRQFTGIIGVQPNTTADVFVREQCPHARRFGVADPDFATYELTRKRIDLFLHDGHAIAWQVSKKEGRVNGVWIPLTEEYMAWAVRRSDTALADEVNGFIQRYKKNGRLKILLDRWFPYGDRITVPVGTVVERIPLAKP